MRNTRRWRHDLEKDLARSWQSDAALSPADTCRVELGLYLMEKVAPNEPAPSLWALLSGYPFVSLKQDSNRHRIFNARHLLTRFMSRHLWVDAIDRYRSLGGSLRGYDVDERQGKFKRRSVAICRYRFDAYEAALSEPLPFTRREVLWAEPGQYRISDRRGQDYGVALPEEASFSNPDRQHALSVKRDRTPLSVPWHELIETARWMDEAEASGEFTRNDWEYRLVRAGSGPGEEGGVQIQTFDDKGRLKRASEIRLDGASHFVGMVSSGKSTLMTVLAAWAARRGLHATLVVGDVITALNASQTLNRVGVNAVPVLGSTRRVDHINTLHKALYASRPDQQIAQEHLGFRWLSTICPLDGMRRDDNPDPFPPDFRPCSSLRPSRADDGRGPGLRHCSLYSVCPYHQAQRDLVDAPVWVATPSSLVYTRVAEQVNEESVRFAELVVRRSDLVVIDEADRVQALLDESFSPNQVLCSVGGDGWLDALEAQVGGHTGRQGRAAVSSGHVERWRRAYHQAQTAADAVYKRLLSNRDLREWIRDLYFFTDLLIFDRLALAMTSEPGKRTATYQGLRQQFDDFIDKGLRALFIDRRLEDERLSGAAGHLVGFANRLLMASDSSLLRKEIRAWLEAQTETRYDDSLAGRLVERLEFAILIAILANRLNALLGRWKEVEEVLGLERTPSSLLYRPPLDYQALIPSTPVGNVLAFQYLHESEGSAGAATLKFLRCTGVGRWLLLNFHNLLADEGIAGPHVLLLSGTSWAGGDPSYHLQMPVSGILRSPSKEIEAIARSEFHFLQVRDERDQPIKVSGLFGERREDALRQMLRFLARPAGMGDGGMSILERERDSLEAGRRRILLVVGSYREAEQALEYLERERPDWRDANEVVRLVADKDSSEGDFGASSRLPRGQVDQFALTKAWLLIAPLMAIDRGHNILNEDRVAAIGSAYFLVRPHPKPQDLSYAIRALNKWAVEKSKELPQLVKKLRSLDAAAQSFRQDARRRWRELLTTDFIYSTLPKQERDLLTWNLMVSVWQVIGRLVRGGREARVYFCDAKFDPVRSGLAPKGVSLLDEMRNVLEPYFTDRTAGEGRARDRALVQELYGPLYNALKAIRY